MSTPTRLAATLLIATVIPVLGAGAAHAKAPAGDVIQNGSCSGSTDWKMKAKPDDGRLQVEAEIDSNRNGQTWAWVLKQNGNVVERGSSVTRGPSGSFSVERRTNNSAGTDSLRFRAVNRAGGEVCVARVSI
jgi:hypothetical protein